MKQRYFIFSRDEDESYGVFCIGTYDTFEQAEERARKLKAGTYYDVNHDWLMNEEVAIEIYAEFKTALFGAKALGEKNS